jgi:hypothetical protein
MLNRMPMVKLLRNELKQNDILMTVLLKKEVQYILILKTERTN